MDFDSQSWQRGGYDIVYKESKINHTIQREFQQQL